MVREAVQGLKTEMTRMAAAEERQAVAAEAQARATASLADGLWALVQGYAYYETLYMTMSPDLQRWAKIHWEWEASHTRKRNLADLCTCMPKLE